MFRTELNDICKILSAHVCIYFLADLNVAKGYFAGVILWAIGWITNLNVLRMLC